MSKKSFKYKGISFVVTYSENNILISDFSFKILNYEFKYSDLYNSPNTKNLVTELEKEAKKRIRINKIKQTKKVK
ncbi:MAG: hypothetical protein ACK41T_00780 [Pseudobdellovibrio sp.]